MKNIGGTLEAIAWACLALTSVAASAACPTWIIDALLGIAIGATVMWLGIIVADE